MSEYILPYCQYAIKADKLEVSWKYFLLIKYKPDKNTSCNSLLTSKWLGTFYSTS